MDYLSSRTINLDLHRSSANPLKYSTGATLGTDYGHSWREDRPTSPSRFSSSIFDRYSHEASFSGGLRATNRSRHLHRRFSIPSLPSSVSPVAAFSGGRNHSSSPFSSAYGRSHSYGTVERKTPTDFYGNSSGRFLSSHAPPPLYSSRIDFTPTRLNFGSTYGMPSSTWDKYNSADSLHSRRSSYVSRYSSSCSSPTRRDTSTPGYSRYTSSPGYSRYSSSPGYSRYTSSPGYSRYSSTPVYYTNFKYSQPRSQSMSRFSHYNFDSPEEKEESFSSGAFKVLKQYSSRDHEHRPVRDSSSSLLYKDADYRKIDYGTRSSQVWSRTGDSPKKSARELYNEIKDALDEDAREKEWLDRTKNEYGRHQRRLSALLTSYCRKVDDPDGRSSNVPDRLEATFTSFSRKSPSPMSSVVTPVITIEKETDEHDQAGLEDPASQTIEDLLREKEQRDISNRDLTKLLKTDNPEEAAKLLLERGESFRPDEISTAILPSGEKALVMTQTKQTAVGDDGVRRRSISPGLTQSPGSGLLFPTCYDSNPPVSDEDQEWANEEIEKFTRLTGEFEESLQTLEHFIAKNRCLFPENIIIYQKIVYHKSPAGEVTKQGGPSSSRRLSFVDGDDICAVRVREKLVLPHGCRRNGYDVTDVLRRCYPRFEEVEVVYDDEENIKETLFKQENGKLNPFDDDFDRLRNSSKAYDAINDGDSGRNSPPSAFVDGDDDDDDDDEVLRRCRRDDECLPYFVTRPRSQTTLLGQPVRFTCAIAGNPEPEVTWYKNGLHLPKDGRFTATNNYGICSLRINATRPDDKGVYTAEIENSVGTVRIEVELDILSTDHHQEHPVNSLAFTRIPPYYVHMSEGDPLTLRCKLQGGKKPRVTWYKGSKEILGDEKFRLMSEGEWQYALQIRDLDPSDASLYTVLADDGLTSVRHSVEVNVAPKRDLDDTITEYEIVKKMGPIKMAPVFVKELPLQHRMKEGSNLLIGCEVDESDPQPHLIGVEIVEKKRKKSEGRDLKDSEYQGVQPDGYSANLKASHGPWNNDGVSLVPPVK